jgi:hypothetical protein
MPPERPERIYLEEDRPLHQRDPESLSDAEAITRLVQVEADIAGSHALRTQLIALVAAQRPASADRPADRPGAAGPATGTRGGARSADVAAEADLDLVPEVLDVSEWLAHELQMAHPYSFTAAQDLVETSLILNGRLSAHPQSPPRRPRPPPAPSRGCDQHLQPRSLCDFGDDDKPAGGRLVRCQPAVA